MAAILFPVRLKPKEIIIHWNCDTCCFFSLCVYLIAFSAAILFCTLCIQGRVVHLVVYGPELVEWPAVRSSPTHPHFSKAKNPALCWNWGACINALSFLYPLIDFRFYSVSCGSQVFLLISFILSRAFMPPSTKSNSHSVYFLFPCQTNCLLCEQNQQNVFFCLFVSDLRKGRAMFYVKK